MAFALTRSQKLLLFWFILIIGLVIGSKVSFPLLILCWLTIVWLIIFISGQNKDIEIVALVFCAGLIGILIWQLTDGEHYIELGFLGNISAHLMNFRDKLVDKIFLALPEPHGSLLTGILLGNRVRLDRELIETFRTVGLSHLIAVSGYNLTVLTANVRTLFSPLLGRKSLYLSLAVIILFVLISGAPSSILRAALMSTTFLISGFIGRPNRSINILILSAGVLALLSPKIVFDIGFQLSVAATYGLIRLSPIIRFGLRNVRLPKIIIGVISETLAATIMTAPLIIIHFERLSVISPLTNILVVPFIPILMGLGIVASIFLLIIPTVGQWLAQLSWPILEWIIQVSKKAEGIKFASTNLVLPDLSVICIILALIIALELLSRITQKRMENSELEFQFA